MSKIKTCAKWEMENRTTTKPKKKVRRVTAWFPCPSWGPGAINLCWTIRDVGIFRTKKECLAQTDSSRNMHPKKITIEWEE